MAEQLAQLIIRVIRNTDQSDQRQAEAAMLSFSERESQTFCLLLLQIASQHTDEKVRMFAISHLRKRVSLYSEKSFNLLWPRLDPESQAAIKQGLFAILEVEAFEPVRNLTADCIGELGGSLLGQNQWPELIQLVWGLFMKEQAEQLHSGFKILINLLSFAANSFDSHKKDLAQLFTNGIKNSNWKVQAVCIQSIGAYVNTLNAKQAKEFQPLVPMMLQSLYSQTRESEECAHIILEVFSDIVENEPRFLKDNFEMLFSTIWKINMEEADVDVDLKHKGTEVIISLLQRLPVIAKNNDAYIEKVIEMIFKHMIEIDENVSDEWMKPPEGFNEDIEEDADFETTRFGMNSIDRLIDSIGDEQVLPILSATVQKLLQHFDWRYNFSAIMALSQVGEYIDEVSTVSPIIDTVLRFLTNQNPMLRYSVFHAIGQISDDMKPKFQMAYKDTIMPILLQYLDDPVPRVISHTAAAMTNFVEGFSDTDIAPYLQQTLQKLFHQLLSGCSIVKENCMTAIASVAEASKHSFHPYFQDSMTVLLKIFSSFNTKEYRQLRGQTIECISLIAHSIDKKEFIPYLDSFVSIIIQVQSSTTTDSVNPEKQYILTGWQRLSYHYSEELKVYLPQMLPGIVKLIDQIIKRSGNESGDNDEALTAVQMLQVLIEQFGAAYSAYVEPTTKLIAPLVQIQYSDSIRKSVARCFPGLIRCASSDSKTDLVKFYVNLLLNATQNEYDTSVMIAQVQATKNCIHAVGQYMNLDELENLQRKIIKLLMDSDTRKGKSEEWRNEDDVDEYEKDMLEEDLDLEEELQVSIAELVGVLFKTHTLQTVQLADLLYTQILPKVLNPSVSDKMHRFGLYLINDMVEFMGYDLMQNKWAEFATALTMFSNDKAWRVRSAALYGIGVFALRTPADKLQQYQDELIKSLVSALKIPQGPERLIDFGIARDRAVSAIGKIMKTQGMLIAPKMFVFWIQHMPIKYDWAEANLSYQFLSEIVVNRSDLIASLDIAAKILLAFAQIMDAKPIKPDTVNAIKIALQQYTTNPLLSEHLQQILTTLPPAVAERLQREFVQPSQQQHQ